MTLPRLADRLSRRLFAAVTAGAALLTLASPAAQAAERPEASSFVRLAHLAPDIAGVDVTLTPFSSSEAVSFDELGYGEVSEYRSIAPGFYNATLMPADDPNAAPVLTASLEVTPGAAATVAVSGTGQSRAATVLTDDLTPPPPGQARVRLLQGASSAPSVDVAAVDGPVIAEDVAFGEATGYANVPAGTWTIRVTPSGGSPQPVTTETTLRAGSVQTLLLLDEGGLTARVIADGEGMPQMPSGGVQAGAGSAAGLLEGSRPGEVTVGVLTLAGVAGLAVTAGLLRRAARASGASSSTHRRL